MARRLEVWLSASVLALMLLYWLAWCLIGPVTNVDSQLYNLGRLWVIEGNGLFLNRFYTWNAQLIMPWSFDVVHYPFIHLHYGHALPSFLCLLGIMAILFTWARERGDVADGLRGCLGLLAMPMVVVQATTTKNDLVLAFCLLCWIAALRRYARRPAPATVLLAALALAFGAGSKLTGLLYAGAAVAVSLWILRRRPSHVAWFVAGFGVMLVVNGSLEIYVNNQLQFGDWRGDPLLYRYNSNNDGWRGFVANELRYGASLFDLQLLPSGVLHRFALLKFEVCQYLLRAFRLQDLGLMSLPWRPLNDDDLRRLMTTSVINDARSTYGLVGALLMTVAPAAFFVRRRFDFPAALFLGGVTVQALIAFTLGWHIGNHRYLVAAPCLSWAGASLLIVSRRVPSAALGLTVLLAICAVLAPFIVVRSPEKLALAFRDRDSLLPVFSREMMSRARAWKQNGELPVVLTADHALRPRAGYVPFYHLYEQLAPEMISIPNLTDEDMINLDGVYRRGTYRIVAIGTEPKLSDVVCEEGSLPYGTRICIWSRR